MTKVFISHQKLDREPCAQIAKYLKDAGIEVYFDEFDKDLQQATQANDPKGVVNAIKKGVNQSTHMLCVISPNTLNSKWVPFEVGYGYDKTYLGTLTLKGIKSSELPEFIKIAPIIRDIYDLNKFVEQHGNKYLFETRKYKDYSSYSHPLANIMDPIIS
jgi:predicted metal-dependent phosphotriesterase family hydrolase